jgi:sn-glycerol 3-phosphate transport system permease protein
MVDVTAQAEPRRAVALAARLRLHLPRWQAAAGYLLMLGGVIAIGLPVYWMIAAAFKTLSEIYSVPVTWIPREPVLSNFTRAWHAAPFGRYYINTIITTAFGSGAELFFAITSAYAFAFLRFPKKNWVFLVLLAALMIPNQVTLLPNYLTVARLGWINTYQGIIVPGAAVAYGTFMLRQYFQTLPRELLDAAKVDGAGHLRTLWHVVLPLAQPAVITFGLISIVAKWNDFAWPLVVTNTQDMRVLPIGIYWLLDQEGNTQWGTVMAGTIFVVLPVLLIFLWAQRYIVEGMTAGAVKG